MLHRDPRRHEQAHHTPERKRRPHPEVLRYPPRWNEPNGAMPSTVKE